jgi:hypothetical protein
VRRPGGEVGAERRLRPCAEEAGCRDAPVAVEENEPERPPDDDDGLVLRRVEVAVGTDVLTVLK